MNGIIKPLLMVIAVVALAVWLFTIVKTCNETQDPLLENDLTENVNNGIDRTKANVEDLYEKGEASMDDLKKEAIKAKDKMAMKTEDVFEREERDRLAEAKTDEMREKGGAASKSNTSRSSRTGEYFVVTGSFLQKENAEALKKKLRNSGYPDAEVVIFDLSQYYTVFANRYDEIDSAEELASSIKNKMGIPAYVHEKRSRFNR